MGSVWLSAQEARWVGPFPSSLRGGEYRLGYGSLEEGRRRRLALFGERVV